MILIGAVILVCLIILIVILIGALSTKDDTPSSRSKTTAVETATPETEDQDLRATATTLELLEVSEPLSKAENSTQTPPALIQPRSTPLMSLEDILTSYIGTFELIWVANNDALNSAVEDLLGHQWVSLDTETAIKNERKLNVLILARVGRVYVVDPLASGINLNPLQQVLDSCIMVFHQASHDIPIIAKVGLKVKLYFDTLTLSRFLHKTKGHGLTELPKSNGLKACSAYHLGLDIPEMEREEHDHWHERPLTQKQLHYAALDGEATIRLAKLFEPATQKAIPYCSARDAYSYELEALIAVRKELAPYIHPMRIFCVVQKTQAKLVIDAVDASFVVIKQLYEVPTLMIQSGSEIDLSAGLSNIDMAPYTKELLNAVQEVLEQKAKKAQEKKELAQKKKEEELENHPQEISSQTESTC